MFADLQNMMAECQAEDEEQEKIYSRGSGYASSDALGTWGEDEDGYDEPPSPPDWRLLGAQRR